ncbi:hypothetical protein Tcan_16721 [Toxocara canis]|uniref:Uncharacterized protein n=1 Tax=Toxocara canis TaxID=6265 RepID=A0A0B2VAV3_TOXCA|nr:hypothetical protein Tcan_16721 [Toxocara canis]
MSRSSNAPSKYHLPLSWMRKGGTDREVVFERRLSSSNAHCSRSRSRSRSNSPRDVAPSQNVILGERLPTSGSLRRSIGGGLSRMAPISPYPRLLDHTARRFVSAPRSLPEVLQSAASPEPVQVEYFDQPQYIGRSVAGDLPECDVVEVGRHILGQSYATVEDIRVGDWHWSVNEQRGKGEWRSFVNELPIEGAHVDMASLLDAIQAIDSPNATDLVFPLVGMAALVNNLISANEDLRDEVIRLKGIVNSLTRAQIRSPSVSREFHYTPTHITGNRMFLSTRTERKLVYNPMRIANRRFPVPSVRGIPAREDLGAYITELSGDGEFIKDKSVIAYIQKISRYIIFRMIPPELYNSFSVRTRERGVTYIDFPQVYLKTIAELHIACCGVQPGDNENEHYIVSASDCAVKTALNDLRRKPPKISVKAKTRNEQEYGRVYEENEAAEGVSESGFEGQHAGHSSQRQSGTPPTVE